MKVEKDWRLEEGYYSEDYKKLTIVDADTKEVIAEGVKKEYALAIIKAVNNFDIGSK